MSMAGFRPTTCEYCGKRFMDDCGDSFCSSSCENAYERENDSTECTNCGYEYNSEHLTNGLCEDCEEELEDDE